jgi:hypothetical protein
MQNSHIQYLLKLANSTEHKKDMLSTNVQYLCEFCILKKILDLPHEKLVNILGGHGVRTKIHARQPNLEIAIRYLCTKISKWQ